MITTLRQGFVNAWLLAKDLDGIAERSGDADLAALCKLIKANYGYPVDSVLITADLRVVGHLNVHDARATQAEGYLGFLREGLAAARGEAQGTAQDTARGSAPGAGEPVAASRPARAAAASRPHGIRTVQLTPAEPTGTVLDVLQRQGFGKQSLVFFPLDATAFPGGGTIEVKVRLGGAAVPGKFELCAAVQGGMAPVQTLDKVAPGETERMTWEFAKGAMFGLAVMPGPGSPEGVPNAFLATVTVRGR